ncbi:hypothetical protein BSKO_07131 [Bryopsis sp. KO-2023]|nr:hypothetical protein BSKO_07131 [Bryopsis sp. KO-2023]
MFPTLRTLISAPYTAHGVLFSPATLCRPDSHSSFSKKNPLASWRPHSTCRRSLRVPAAGGFPDAVFDQIKKLVGAEGETGPAGRKMKAKAFKDTAPSWSELEALVEQQKGVLGVEDDDLESGPPNPLSLKRTFGKDEPIRVKLYRDHAAWCPYCQKVWIQLEEKKIPYEIEKINMRCYGDKKPSFLKITPMGLLPVMEFKGNAITESERIMKILEKEYPENPLLPAEGTPEMDRASKLFRLERACFSAWCGWLCSAWAQESQKKSFEAAMSEVDRQLGATDSPYFLEDFSMVDIVFSPFLERMDASITYYKGFRMRGEGRFPNIDRWFEAMEARPTYIATKSDYYTHAHALPPQLGGCEMVKEGEPVAARIDGGEWSYPLSPLDGKSFEPYSPGESPPVDRFLAGKRLVENRVAVTKFALRGCGEEGRPVMAPLSNPNAIPNEDYHQDVDGALRHVAHALLIGVEEKQSLEKNALSVVGSEGGGEALAGQPTYVALGYLRDRVGVPRDLKLPAARQLRSHLTWIMSSITA